MPAAAEAGQQADFLSDSTAREAFAGVLQSDFFSTVMVALTAEPQLPAAVFTAAEVHSASEEAADVRTALTAEPQLLPAAVLAADELQSPSAEAADVSAALIAEPQLLAVAVAHSVFFPSVPDLSFPVKFSEKADIPAKAITVNMTNIFFIITRFLFILIWIKYRVSNPEKMLTEC
jgi:hypothetical protein